MKTNIDFDEDSDELVDFSSDSDFVHIGKRQKKAKVLGGTKAGDAESPDFDDRKPKKRGRSPKIVKKQQHQTNEIIPSIPSMMEEPRGPLWQRKVKASTINDTVESNNRHEKQTNDENAPQSAPAESSKSVKPLAKIVKPKQTEEAPMYVIFTYADRQFPESNAEVKVGLGDAYLKGPQKHLTLKSFYKPQEGATDIVNCLYYKAAVEETYLDSDSIVFQNFTLVKGKCIELRIPVCHDSLQSISQTEFNITLYQSILVRNSRDLKLTSCCTVRRCLTFLRNFSL